MYWFSEVYVSYGSCMEIIHYLWYFLGQNYRVVLFFLISVLKACITYLQTGQHHWTDRDQLYSLTHKFCWEISGGPKSGWNKFDIP